MKKLLFFLLGFVSVNAFSQSIFDYVTQNNYEAVKSYTGNVNVRDTNMATPLMWAIYKSDLKMVKLLISKGADPKLKGWIKFQDTVLNGYFIYGNCLSVAAGEGKLDIVKYLIKKQKIPVDDREINFYQADKKINYQAGKENGWTALHWAAVKGQVDVIKYLVKKGADINAVAETHDNATPLIFAIMFKQKDAAMELINLGADINKSDAKKLNPLDYAMMNDCPDDFINFMKQKGAKTYE